MDQKRVGLRFRVYYRLRLGRLCLAQNKRIGLGRLGFSTGLYGKVEPCQSLSIVSLVVPVFGQANSRVRILGRALKESLNPKPYKP